MFRRLPLLWLVAVLVPSALSARVISYAPYSDRISTPALGHRLNRHFALIETRTSALSADGIAFGQIVLYDSKGEEEPRPIFPANGGEDNFAAVAVREPAGEPPQILAITVNGAWNLSVDGGKTWKSVNAKGTLYKSFYGWPNDFGGWTARGRYSNLRTGTREVPFVAVVGSPYTSNFRLIAVKADGSVKDLLTSSFNPLELIGSDDQHQRFLVRRNSYEIDLFDGDGILTRLGYLSFTGASEGWITATGAAYIETYFYDYYSGGPNITLALLTSTGTSIVDRADGAGAVNRSFFAVPTSDSNGAWIIKRDPGRTRLFSHDPRFGMVEQWSDPTAPQVEAIIPSSSPDKILLQVHRPRRSPDPLVTFKDPALAIWRIGQPAPSFYDELYMDESSDKGFVHVDVDALERGETFVFDSGRRLVTCGCGVSAGGGSGGGDVVQEWGVVRGALAQRLVLPGFGRTGGAFGSAWRSDLTLQNPNDRFVDVALRFVPSGAIAASAQAPDVHLLLGPREIRLIADAAKELFHVEAGVGALFIAPESTASVDATARTYTTTADGKGTYGYGMNAIDVYTAASPRFPVIFAAAFPGEGFRTNLFLTDVSGSGSSATLAAATRNGPLTSLSFDVAPAGVAQQNDLGSTMAFPSFAPSGALTVTPRRGAAIASLFVVDNRTNDASFLPPDVALGVSRVIPAIGRIVGLNGTQYRSDLFIDNQSPSPRSVTLELQPWTGASRQLTTMYLAGGATLFVPDIGSQVSGMARLRLSTLSGGAETTASARTSAWWTSPAAARSRRAFASRSSAPAA